MNSKSWVSTWLLVAALSGGLALGTGGCGGAGTSVGNPAMTLQTNPLAGPNAASNGARFLPLALLERGLVEGLLGIQTALAAVSPFTTFRICLNTLEFERLDGSKEEQNGSSNIPLNPGLLTFSPVSHDPMTLGTLLLTEGSVLKNVKFTIATVPELCGGANYAIRFNSGTGDVDLTQNVAFRFDFPAEGLRITSESRGITLLLGAIVNGMVTLANAGNLNNSTVQTVNVGQAQ
jgi:hypothetical protein